jgi:RNA polymerase sigma-70 factor, ECF subfamily
MCTHCICFRRGQPTPSPDAVYPSTETQRTAPHPLLIAPQWRSISGFMTSAGFTTGPPDGFNADEPGLVAQVQQGDTEAYAVLVRRHLPRAYRIAWRVLRHREESEDAVQDAFLRALERIDQCDPERPFGPWFFRIVATTAINRQRSSKRRETDELSETEVSDAIGPADSATLSVLRGEVNAAFATLPPMQKQLIELVTFEEFTPTEAAQVLEIPAGTARWHLHEARKALRTQLRSWLGDGGEDE